MPLSTIGLADPEAVATNIGQGQGALSQTKADVGMRAPGSQARKINDTPRE
jgi:hypothetical protein